MRLESSLRKNERAVVEGVKFILEDVLDYQSLDSSISKVFGLTRLSGRGGSRVVTAQKMRLASRKQKTQWAMFP